jgi:hypothetical protein
MTRQGGFEGLAQMQRNLVRKKVKVHPRVGGATLLATQNATIKATCFVQVGDMKCEMKKTVHARKHISQSGSGAAGRTRMRPSIWMGL